MSYAIELLDGSAQRWTITDYANLGSDSSCSIRIEMPGVSSRHLRLEVRQNKLYAKDLRSENGTFVNSAQVIEGCLKDGDLITAGYAEFVVHDLELKTTEFPLSSKNEYWQQQLATLNHVAKTDFPILLLGPSGTGKDVLAKNLHESSKRSEAAFLSVNCSALTETLVESELFGHVKGSFTGAIADRKGAFEAARGGTLFLDEIGDLPYSLQAKILRAIENQEIRPVGSDRTIKTDVRIIAATHQNLKEKIQEGTFRSDLFYRLNVITVMVPSLKERLEDFETLLYNFARDLRVRFSFNAVVQLKKYGWPGNIRELKNIVAKASALYPKQYITEQHINLLLNNTTAQDSLQQNGQYNNALDNKALPVIKEIEKQMILKRLAANRGNQKMTATDLGIPKSTLHDRIKNYNIDVRAFRA